MGENLDYIRMFAQFPFSLRRFLRRKLTPEEAKRTVAERIVQRDENFLRIVERCIYGHPASPYLALLQWAGCELGDVKALVRQDGVEGALRKLRASGVYVTFEEFKGRKPITRNRLHLPVRARDFDNPFARRDFTLQTGGSTGLATAVSQDFDYIAAGAPHQVMMLQANGLWDAPAVVWMNMLPGNALRFIFQRAHIDQRVDVWLSQTGWRESKYWVKYGLATVYMVFCARLLGCKIPLPQVTPLNQAETVARVIHDVLQKEGRCIVYIGASRGLRVSVAAQKLGLDLVGAVARIGGEPITEAKVDGIVKCGLRVIPAYGTVELGTLGFACLNPVEVDEVHLHHDAFALITHPHEVEGSGISVPAFNITTLVDSSTKLMFNVQTDDYGVVEERRCGCAYEQHGYTTHIHGIRSYSKLVGESVTLLGNEVLRILEETLPARFGGSALDYQLLEEEDEQGFTRLYLLVSPRLAIADEQEVIDTLHRALADSSPMGDAARAIWQQARTIRIRRQEPVATNNSKLLTLHVRRT